MDDVVDSFDDWNSWGLDPSEKDYVELPATLAYNRKAHPHLRKVSSFMMGGMMAALKTPTGAMGAGAAAAGGLMYLHCKAKCPGGAGTGSGIMGAMGGMAKQAFSMVKGAVGGAASAVGGMFGGGGDEEEPYGMEGGKVIPPADLVVSIHKRTCSCNCKMDALLAAAAGAAAGHMAGNMMSGGGMSGMEGPLDEWTTGPFMASTLSKDGCDYLGLDFKRTKPGEEPRARDGLSDFTKEFYSSFLCLEATNEEEDDSLLRMHQMNDGEHSSIANPQDCDSCCKECGLPVKRHGEKRPCDTPARWHDYFQEVEEVAQERLA